MKQVISWVLVLTFFASCKVAFVPVKNEAVITRVVDLQTSTEDLYDRMIISPDKRYTLFIQDYNSLSDRIDSLVTIDEQRKNSANLVSQVNILKKYFIKYKADHQNRIALNSSELKIYKDYLRSLFKPILVSELSLK